METFLLGLKQAVELIISGDPLVMGAALRSLTITSVAIFLSMIIGLPLGYKLAIGHGKVNACLSLMFRAGMAIPTVFLGVLCFSFFSNSGPLGPLKLLYTPSAIVFGEVLLSLPIIVSLTQSAIRSLEPRVRETILVLGAPPLLQFKTLLKEAQLGVSLAVLTAFARCVTELGIAMMVGGNIQGHTRTLATATALEATRGEHVSGLAMGFLLLLISLLVATLIAIYNHKSSVK